MINFRRRFVNVLFVLVYESCHCVLRFIRCLFYSNDWCLDIKKNQLFAGYAASLADTGLELRCDLV